jgi:hypothetical protein
LAPIARHDLRAGTSQGLLEEDDAAAIVCRAERRPVINMSFGDIIVRPCSRVIRFAHARGAALLLPPETRRPIRRIILDS